MEEPNVDDGWRTDPMRNENRYQGIIDKSAFPPLAFLYESFREDRTLRFPRMLLSTFWTARRIPRALFLRGERKEAYAVETMKIWSRTMVKMARMNLTVRGVERLRPESNYLFACNHSATLDSVIAYRALPCPAAFVVNQELTSLPVIKYWLEKSRCVLVRQGDREAETRAFGELLSRLKEKKISHLSGGVHLPGERPCRVQARRALRGRFQRRCDRADVRRRRPGCHALGQSPCASGLEGPGRIRGAHSYEGPFPR